MIQNLFGKTLSDNDLAVFEKLRTMEILSFGKESNDKKMTLDQL